MSFAFAAGLAVASLVELRHGCAEITGAGATFPFPVYAKWAEAYKKETGHQPELPVDRLERRHPSDPAKTVDFGATDAPLKGEELEKDGFVQFPMRHGRRRRGLQHPGHRSRASSS